MHAVVASPQFVLHETEVSTTCTYLLCVYLLTRTVVYFYRYIHNIIQFVLHETEFTSTCRPAIGLMLFTWVNVPPVIYGLTIIPSDIVTTMEDRARGDS